VSKLKANKANNVNNFHFVTIKEVSRPEKSWFNLWRGDEHV
jgi:hypothetical protein